MRMYQRRTRTITRRVKSNGSKTKLRIMMKMPTEDINYVCTKWLMEIDLPKIWRKK